MREKIWRRERLQNRSPQPVWPKASKLLRMRDLFSTKALKTVIDSNGLKGNWIVVTKKNKRETFEKKAQNFLCQPNESHSINQNILSLSIFRHNQSMFFMCYYVFPFWNWKSFDSFVHFISISFGHVLNNCPSAYSCSWHFYPISLPSNSIA